MPFIRLWTLINIYQKIKKSIGRNHMHFKDRTHEMRQWVLCFIVVLSKSTYWLRQGNSRTGIARVVVLSYVTLGVLCTYKMSVRYCIQWITQKGAVNLKIQGNYPISCSGPLMSETNIYAPSEENKCSTYWINI